MIRLVRLGGEAEPLRNKGGSFVHRLANEIFWAWSMRSGACHGPRALPDVDGGASQYDDEDIPSRERCGGSVVMGMDDVTIDVPGKAGMRDRTMTIGDHDTGVSADFAGAEMDVLSAAALGYRDAGRTGAPDANLRSCNRPIVLTWCPIGHEHRSHRESSLEPFATVSR